MSGTILTRIDDLGGQLDELERAVSDLATAVRAQGLRACARGADDASRRVRQAEVSAVSDSATVLQLPPR